MRSERSGSPSLADLMSLRTVDPTVLTGHSEGTARANGRAQRGLPRRAREGQSSALKRLYTLREAAAYLGIGYGKVRDFVARGLLPAVRLPGGKLLHIAVEDLEQFVSAHRDLGR